MCAIDDAEPFKVSEERMRTARGNHSCGECGRIIIIGESYRHIRGLDDYGWTTYRTCRHCVAAGVWLDTMCGGYMLHCLTEELREHSTEYPSVVLDELLNAINAKWYDGRSLIPDVEVLKTDAQRCLTELTA